MERIYQLKQTVSVSGGVGSFNTYEIRAILQSLKVKPTTSTTKYKFTLTDDNSIIVYLKAVTGNLIDHHPFDLYGIYTINIAGSSKDEDFDVIINYIEKQ